MTGDWRWVLTEEERKSWFRTTTNRYASEVDIDMYRNTPEDLIRFLRNWLAHRGGTSELDILRWTHGKFPWLVAALVKYAYEEGSDKRIRRPVGKGRRMLRDCLMI